MSLSFKQRNALHRIAKIVSDFLPAAGHPMWKGHVNFGTVAAKLGLSGYWLGGSKLPAIINLLENTYEKKANVFQDLIETVVLEGKTYRNNKGNPLSRNEIDELNKCLLELDFKFPSLHDKEFLSTLFIPDNEPSTPPVVNQNQSDIKNELAPLRDRYYELTQENDRQKAGLELEKILTKIFDIYDLSPREPFRVIGEQIDGAIEFKNDIYLIEVKWTASQVNEGELLKFRGKIEGKSMFTRGVFISINGYTKESLYQIKQGKQPTFFLMDGYDISVILEAQCSLPDLLSHKYRRLCEEGEMLVHFTPETMEKA